VYNCTSLVYNHLRRGVARRTDTPARFPPWLYRPSIGHERVKTKLAGAQASGKLPQALLLAGPRGVGKQRLALWLAQLIHCEAQPRDRAANAARADLLHRCNTPTCTGLCR